MARILLTFCAVFLGLGASLATAEDNWPNFRGDSAGVAEGEQLPLEWSTTKNVAWKTDIPGMGWSSPIVWEDRVFLTTVVNTGEDPEPAKGLYFGGEQKEPAESEHLWKVVCLDLNSGDILWEQTAHRGEPDFTRHKKNSYASETPVTDGERVYVYFGNVGLFCYSLDGELIWDREIGPYKTRLGWGTGASPAIYNGQLLVLNDNEEQSYLASYDAKTGEELWKVERDERSNWATPYVWENDQRTEIVTAGSNAVRSYSLEGELLWELKGMSSITICTPFTTSGMVILGSGYVMDRTRPIYAVKPGASGDISLAEDETSNEFITWSQPQGAPYNTTPLAYKGYVYVCLDRGVMLCFDEKTGEEMYKARIPDGRMFTSSPWAYRDRVMCINEFGMTFVIEPGPEFKVLHTNDLDEMVLATPAIAGDRLLIRTQSKLYCIAEEGGELAAK